MRILVCGANGFVGRHVVQALQAAGHTVLRGARANAPVAMDFARDTAINDWLRRLDGVHAVVNTVGVLRDSRRQPMQAIHAETPIALFKACAQQGVRRVIQVSALGIEGSDTVYASTKRAADAELLALTASGALDAVVLRPSIVFGTGGESSALFLGLAALPGLLLPKVAFHTKVQPIRVQELAEVIAALMGPHASTKNLVECTGPEALPLADFIASLRLQLGKRAALVKPLPDWLTHLSAFLGDVFPFTPWGTQALALLSRNNDASPDPVRHLLGRPATHYSQLLDPLEQAS